MRSKRTLSVICTILLLLISANAHSGRTDSNGGHYNRSTGEYHYHHGYPEHQHENGVCPYDYKDTTGENSGQSDGSESQTGGMISKESPSPSPEETQEPKQKEGISDTMVNILVVVGFIAAPIVLTYCYIGVLSIIDFFKEKKVDKYEDEKK